MNGHLSGVLFVSAGASLLQDLPYTLGAVRTSGRCCGQVRRCGPGSLPAPACRGPSVRWRSGSPALLPKQPFAAMASSLVRPRIAATAAHHRARDRTVRHPLTLGGADARDARLGTSAVNGSAALLLRVIGIFASAAAPTIAFNLLINAIVIGGTASFLPRMPSGGRLTVMAGIRHAARLASLPLLCMFAEPSYFALQPIVPEGEPMN